MAVSETVRLPNASVGDIQYWTELHRSEVYRFGLNLSPNIHNLLDRHQFVIAQFKEDRLPSYYLLDTNGLIRGVYESADLVPNGKLAKELEALHLPKKE